MAVKKLYRSNDNKIIAGVCGGLGEYFKIDPTVLRLGWTFITVFSGLIPGTAIYSIAWLIIPKEPIEPDDETVIIEMSGVRVE